jgi:hypothetical protein
MDNLASHYPTGVRLFPSGFHEMKEKVSRLQMNLVSDGKFRSRSGFSIRNDFKLKKRFPWVYIPRTFFLAAVNSSSDSTPEL